MIKYLKGLLALGMCSVCILLYGVAGLLQVLFTSYVFLLEGVNRHLKFYKSDFEYSYFEEMWEFVEFIYALLKAKLNIEEVQ